MTLKVIAGDVYWATIGNQSTPDVDTGFADWFQDFPHPDDFFRPLLNGEEDPKAKLERLLNERKPLYKSLADLRIKTAELTPQETAYGVMESARVFFARRQKHESVS